MLSLVGWPLGLLLAALSSVFGILGKLFLKIAHNQREQEEIEEELRIGTDHLEVVGTASSKHWFMYFYAGLFAILVLNPVLASVAYCFASQSLLAPMAGLTIGWNTLIGPLLLPKERLTTHDLVGAALIFTGCVCVGVSAIHETPPLPVDDLARRFGTLPFVLYLTAMSCVVVFLLVMAKPALEASWYKASSGSSSAGPRRTGTASIESSSSTTVSSVGSSTSSRKQALTQISRVCLSVLAGTTSGQLFFLAATMRLLHENAAGAKSMWLFPVTYVCITGALATAAIGLWLLNQALKVEDAVVVIYLYEASYILSGAISGLCFFQDMNSLSAWHYVVYSLSIAVMLMGIYVVAQREGSTDNLAAEKEHLLPLLVAPSATTANAATAPNGEYSVLERTKRYFLAQPYITKRRSSSPRHFKELDVNVMRRKSASQLC